MWQVGAGACNSSPAEAQRTRIFSCAGGASTSRQLTRFSFTCHFLKTGPASVMECQPTGAAQHQEEQPHSQPPIPTHVSQPLYQILPPLALSRIVFPT